MRALMELQVVKEWSFQGLYSYWRSPWNKQDVATIALTLAALVLRVQCVSIEDADAAASYAQVARSLYALTSVFIFFRGMQYLRYYKSVGVLTIVLGEMLEDVSLFTLVLMNIVIGFSVAFGVLLADQRDMWSSEWLGDAPIWAPVWGVFGQGGMHKSAIIRYTEDEPEIITRVAPWFVLGFLFFVLVLMRLLISMLAYTVRRWRSHARPHSTAPTPLTICSTRPGGDRSRAVWAHHPAERGLLAL